MADQHIASIGAGMFSDLSVAMPSTAFTSAALAALDTQSEFDTLFASLVESEGGVKGTNTFVRIKNVREFPAMGTPPNIVNVPTYGQKTSQQIQGQSDAPSMEIQLNFVGTEWSSTSLLGAAVGDAKQYVFRFALMNAEPGSTFASTAGAGGLGKSNNSVWYWIGKLEALVVNPQLTDANTATLTLSVQSKFFGAFSISAS